MFNQDDIIQKVAIEAEVILTDGTVLTGYFYVKQEQRLIDLFNDQRGFIPFSVTEGSVQLIRKSTIDRVIPVDQTVPGRKKGTPGWFGN